MKKFKGLLGPSRASTPIQSILGQEYETQFVEPPMEMDPDEGVSLPSAANPNKAQSLNTHNRKALERDDVVKGYHPQGREPGLPSLPDSNDSPSGYNAILNKSTRRNSGSIRSIKMRDDIDDLQSKSPKMPLSRTSSTTTKRSVEGTRGHARDPLEEECPFLSIGPSTFTGSGSRALSGTETPPMILDPDPSIPSEVDTITEPEYPMVSESPGAADFDVYETAYRQEVERIRESTLPEPGALPKVYLTRRVDGKDELMKLVRETTMSEPVLGLGRKVAVPAAGGFGSAVSMIRAQLDQGQQQNKPQAGGSEPSGPVRTTGGEENTSTSSTQTPAPAQTEGSISEDQKGRLRSLFGRAKRSRSP